MKTFKKRVKNIMSAFMLMGLIFSTLSCDDEIDPNECCEGPDYAFVEASIICPTHENYQVGWEVTVINLGKTGGSTSVQAWLSNDALPNSGDDEPAGGRITDFMDANGGTSTFSFGATLSVDISDYNYLILQIDHNEETEECNEDNNFIVIEIPSNYPQDLCGVSCANSDYDYIAAQESEMSNAQILATDASGFIFLAGDVILYKTKEGRFGRFTIVDIDASENNKLTFNGATFNSDGSIYKQKDGVEIRGTWSADLDELIEAPAGQTSTRDFFWQRVNADTTYLTPQNTAIFKLCDND